MNGIKNIYDESQMIRDLLSKLFFDRLQKYQSILLRNALYRVGVYYLNRNFIKFIFKNEKLNRTIKKNIRKINFTATNFYIAADIDVISDHAADASGNPAWNELYAGLGAATPDDLQEYSLHRL